MNDFAGITAAVNACGRSMGTLAFAFREAARWLAIWTREQQQVEARQSIAYACAHDGRLPGSTRTARLRKKRRDAVLRWWRSQ